MTARAPLLSPDTRRIGRPPGPAFPDRAPDSLAAGTPPTLRDGLSALLGSDRVLHRAIDLVAYASDASPYRLLPAVVVIAHDAEDVGKTIAYAHEHGLANRLLARHGYKLGPDPASKDIASTAGRRRSSWPGACARACSGSSGGCACPARR